MTVWRLAASNTHLYPGARLHALEAGSFRQQLRAGDAIPIEFTDQGTAQAEAADVLPQGWQLRVQAHTTARGTTVSARRWQVQWLPRTEGEGRMKIKARTA